MLKQGLQVLFHIVMARFPIPENCSAYVPMILKEFCSSKINGMVMKNLQGNNDIMIDSCTYIHIYILKIAELDCCQIIILSIYVPSTHAYTHVLRLSLDLPYETR